MRAGEECSGVSTTSLQNKVKRKTDRFHTESCRNAVAKIDGQV